MQHNKIIPYHNFVLRNLLQRKEPIDKSALSAELKVYVKILSDIYEADGILFHNHKVIVPTEWRSDMLKRIHEGHLGMDKCKALGRSTLYWPGMYQDIENVVSRCITCNGHCRQQQHESLLPHPVSEFPSGRRQELISLRCMVKTTFL